jgi:hypothetical protein
MDNTSLVSILVAITALLLARAVCTEQVHLREGSVQARYKAYSVNDAVVSGAATGPPATLISSFNFSETMTDQYRVTRGIFSSVSGKPCSLSAAGGGILFGLNACGSMQFIVSNMPFSLEIFMNTQGFGLNSVGTTALCVGGSIPCDRSEPDAVVVSKSSTGTVMLRYSTYVFGDTGVQFDSRPKLHIVLTYDGSRIRLYANTHPSISVLNHQFSSSDGLSVQIGAISQLSTSLTAKLLSVRIWEGVLSATQIDANFLAGPFGIATTSTSSHPTYEATIAPTTVSPSLFPSVRPTNKPSPIPTGGTNKPNHEPSFKPMFQPTEVPTQQLSSPPIIDHKSVASIWNHPLKYAPAVVLVALIVVAVFCCARKCWPQYGAASPNEHERRHLLTETQAAEMTSRSQTSTADHHPARFVAFISYRFETEAELAMKLKSYLELQCGIHTFLDDSNLQPGHHFRDGFISALENCVVFVPLMSRKGLKNFASLGPDSDIDNLFLEFAAAVFLKRKGRLKAIYPVFIGDKKKSSGKKYGDFFVGRCAPDIKDEKIVNNKIEEEMRKYFGRKGYKGTSPVKKVMGEIMNSKGKKFDGEFAPIATGIQAAQNPGANTVPSWNALSDIWRENACLIS